MGSPLRSLRRRPTSVRKPTRIRSRHLPTSSRRLRLVLSSLRGLCRSSRRRSTGLKTKWLTKRRSTGAFPTSWTRHSTNCLATKYSLLQTVLPSLFLFLCPQLACNLFFISLCHSVYKNLFIFSSFYDLRLSQYHH